MSGRAMNRTHSFVAQHQLTDDEDSPSDGYFDDYRSLRSERRDSSARSIASRRSMRNSTDDDSEQGFGRGSQRATNGGRRDRRGGSLNRSVQHDRTPPAVKVSTATSTGRSNGDRLSIGSPDSESEPGTKELVQAKIREKLAQQSSVEESASDFWTTSPLKKEQPRPKSEEVQPKPKAISPEPVEPEILRMINNDPIESNLETEDQGPIGPPPAAPTFEWICEFCTFVNEPNIKICTICCKTPTAVPVSVDGQSNQQLAPKPINRAASPKPTSDSSGCNASTDDHASASGPGSADKTKGKTRKISFVSGTKPK